MYLAHRNYFRANLGKKMEMLRWFWNFGRGREEGVWVVNQP